jgi:tripartite-type tricarboxylate transporter receptor subunit TctC
MPDRPIAAAPMRRRRLAALAAATLAAPAAAQPAWAPERPVRMIVGFTAGGSTDTSARLLAAAMAERLGQPVLVDNRPGAGGNIASEAAARATPDGHTVFLATSGNLLANKYLYRSLPYDPDRDFLPLALVNIVPNLIVVHPSVPATTLAELIAYAKANPGRINFGSGGAGTTLHLSSAMLAARAGLELVHVPYRGGAQAATDLVAGKIQMIASPIIEVINFVRGGLLRPLAVTTAERAPLLPEIPAVAESLPGYEVVLWNGLVAPAGTPPAAAARLAAEATAALATPALREKYAEIGSIPKPLGPEEFAAYLRAEAPKFAEIVRVSGARLD